MRRGRHWPEGRVGVDRRRKVSWWIDGKEGGTERQERQREKEWREEGGRKREKGGKERR